MSNILGRGLDILLSGDERAPAARAGTNTNDSQNKPAAGSDGGGEYGMPGERPKESVFWIETVKIKPNPEQPRVHFDEEKIRALADSIRQYGILQPIVVTKHEIDVSTGTQVEYQIIAGERRYRAACMIGLPQIPAVIRREESDKIKLELALIENLQREDLHPLEKAQAYKRLMKDFHLTAREVGLRVGKSREAVTNTVRLLLLPDYIQTAIADGRISEGQARPLISISHSAEDQKTLFVRVVAENLSAREVEREAGQVIARVGPAVRHEKKPDTAVFDATTRSFETKLADTLGTRVSVRRTRGGKGRISIDFFSDEEFQNLMARIAAMQQQDAVAKDATAEHAEQRSLVTILSSADAPDASGMPPELAPPEKDSQEQTPARPEDMTAFTV